MEKGGEPGGKQGKVETAVGKLLTSLGLQWEVEGAVNGGLMKVDFLVKVDGPNVGGKAGNGGSGGGVYGQGIDVGKKLFAIEIDGPSHYTSNEPY